MSEELETTANTNQDTKRLPWPVIIMLSMLGLVIGLGFVLSPTSEEEKLWWVNFLGTTNHGQLLNPPVQLAENSLRSLDGEPWIALKNETFKLVVMTNGACNTKCETMLHGVRQLHVRLNRDYDDVDRGWYALGIDSAKALQQVEKEPGYEVLMPEYSLLSEFADTNLPTIENSPILLMIDPMNLAMMSYDSTHSSSEILEDLEHLLELAR